MMKKTFLIIVSTFLITSNTNAQSVNLHSNAVTLPQLISLYYKDYNNINIVIDDELYKLTKRYKFDVSDLNNDSLRRLLDTLLKQNKIDIRNINGILYFSLSEESEDLFFFNQMKSGNGYTNVLPSEKTDTVGALIEGVSSVQKNLIDDYDSIEVYTPNYLDLDYVQQVVNSMTGMNYSHNGHAMPIYGSKDTVKKVVNFLDKMDIKIPQVEINALLIEYSASESKNTGITFALQALSDKLSISFGSITDFSNVFSFQSTDFSFLASMISTDSRFKVISNPKVLVKSGQTSNFHIGTSTPILESEFSSDERDGYRQSITYRDSGFLLNVQPIIKNKLIDLKINQEISDFQLTKTSNLNSPTLNTRSFSSTFHLKPNQVIVVAGMDQWKDTNSKSGLFFLPSFFDNKQKRNEFTQYILLISANTINENIVNNSFLDPINFNFNSATTQPLILTPIKTTK